MTQSTNNNYLINGNFSLDPKKLDPWMVYYQEGTTWLEKPEYGSIVKDEDSRPVARLKYHPGGTSLLQRTMTGRSGPYILEYSFASSFKPGETNARCEVTTWFTIDGSWPYVLRQQTGVGWTNTSLLLNLKDDDSNFYLRVILSGNQPDETPEYVLFRNFSLRRATDAELDSFEGAGEAALTLKP